MSMIPKSIPKSIPESIPESIISEFKAEALLMTSSKALHQMM